MATFVPTFSVNQNKWASQGPARQLTAVGVEGEVGASYTVFAANWACSECKQSNYPNRRRCMRCKAPKPDDAETIIAPQAGRHNPWREVFDAATKRLYYVNTETQATQWERPEEMGAAPHATGWFGRGAAGSDAAKKYEDQNSTFLGRPARKQAANVAASHTVLEGANEFNIWYGKYMGDHWNNKRGRDPAESRCNVERDAGWTKADKHLAKGGSFGAKGKGPGGTSRYFCLYFARGSCAYGKDCHYAHRLPVQADMDAILQDEIHDVFGRERHQDHRDDMDGVGCVLKPCRTLFVGGLQKGKYATPQALEAALWKNFGEFGEVENVNLISRLSIAFVRYRYRCGAEFGKEAMGNQALDKEEVLNVRWAFDDPNPVAVEAARRADVDAVVNMLEAKGMAVRPQAIGPAEEVSNLRPDEYQQPAAKRLRLDGEPGQDGPPSTPEEEAALKEQYRAAGVIAYPDTDLQYQHGPQDQAAAATAATPSVVSAAPVRAPREVAAAPAAEEQQQQQPPPPPAASPWQPVLDPSTGATYYFNAATMETSWTPPAAPTPATDEATGNATADAVFAALAGHKQHRESQKPAAHS